jgi:hypothetical protein
MFRRITNIMPAAVLGAFLLVLTGCGEPIGKISGKLTYKGAPITAGSISFNMKGKGVAQDAKLDATGAFRMSAPLPTGTYHVYYVPPTPEPQDPSKGQAPVIATAVPIKYQDLLTSDLSFEIKRGTNDIPIELTD